MNKIRVYQNYLEIEATADDQAFMQLLTTQPNIYKQRTRNQYRCSLHLLPEVLAVLRNIPVGAVENVPDSIVSFYREEMNRRLYTSELLASGASEEPVDGLWQHQQLGVEIARYNRRFNFFYDTRTGKTRMSFRIIYEAIRDGRVKRCLVVCPATIVQAWLEDAKQYPMLKVVAYYKDEKQQQAALTTPAHVIIWSAGMFATRLELLKQCKFDMCFFDESSKLKNHKSETAKAALELSLLVPCWYNLSATPAPNGEHEYYVQMRTVDPYSFNPARTHFVGRYFINYSRNANYEKLALRPDMHDEFMSIIKECSLYVDQSVMPTAGKKWHSYRYTLDPAVRERYDQMRIDMSLEIDEETEITVDMAAAMRAKLQQMASGFILDTEAIKENKTIKKLHLPDDLKQECYIVDEQGTRIAALQRLITENIGWDQQIVIWANYVEEFNQLQYFFDRNARVIRGGTSVTEREEYIADFQAGKFKYLLCHPKSVSMGIRLTAAHHAIYYSMTDSWEDLKQSSDRIYGHIAIQPYECHYWVLLADNTTNELVYDNVSHKREASTGLLEHLKAVHK